jgi:hypothetical protein
MDRPDIMYSVKEICRDMAAPSIGSWKKLKRLGRYLIAKPRAVMKLHWQECEKEIEGYSDSDWAGCRKTAKSTSGGVVMAGSHFLKGWSRTQHAVTMSSAEAELVGIVKTSAEVLGMISLARDLGEEKRGSVWTDSAAALSITQRQGAGKIRHINVGMLWIQQKNKDEEIKYIKIKGEENPADLMTKIPNSKKIEDHLKKMNVHLSNDRAESSLRAQGT